MTAESSSEPRERFEREGFIEFPVRPAKAISQALVIVVIAAVGLMIAWAHGPLLGAGATLFAVWMLGALALLSLDQLFGAGPALRIDRDGVTLRRWDKPLVLAWSDVCAFFPRQPSNRFGPQVAILMSQWVWHDYRTSRPRVLAWADRVTHYRGRYLVLLKVLDYSARDVLAFLNEAKVDSLTRLEPPYRLVLDWNEDGESPLWMRGGREAPLERLPLSSALVRAITDWNRRLSEIAEIEKDDGTLSATVNAMVSQGRVLAAQIQGELGPGSQVRASTDVPKFNP